MCAVATMAQRYSSFLLIYHFERLVRFSDQPFIGASFTTSAGQKKMVELVVVVL